MRNITKGIGIFLAVVIIGLGICWIAQGNHFFMYKVFGVQYENTRREIFESTKSYEQGQIQEMEEVWKEWVLADSQTQKDALVSIALRRSASWPDNVWNACSPELRSWLQAIQDVNTTVTTPY